VTLVYRRYQKMTPEEKRLVDYSVQKINGQWFPFYDNRENLLSKLCEMYSDSELNMEDKNGR